MRRSCLPAVAAVAFAHFRLILLVAAALGFVTAGIVAPALALREPPPPPAPSPSVTPTPSSTPSTSITPSVTPSCSITASTTPSRSPSPSASTTASPSVTSTPSSTPPAYSRLSSLALPLGVSAAELAVDHTGRYLLASDDGGGVYTSSDSGATWGARLQGPGAVGATPLVPTTAQAFTTLAVLDPVTKRVFNYTTPQVGWLPEAPASALASSAAGVGLGCDLNGVVCLALDSDGGYLFTFDSRQSWTAKMTVQTATGCPSKTNRRFAAVAVAAVSSSNVAAFEASGEVWMSTDGGATFNPPCAVSSTQPSCAVPCLQGLLPAFPIVAAAASPGAEFFVALDTGGGAFVSNDKGATWAQRVRVAPSGRGVAFVKSTTPGVTFHLAVLTSAGELWVGGSFT